MQVLPLLCASIVYVIVFVRGTSVLVKRSVFLSLPSLWKIENPAHADKPCAMVGKSSATGATGMSHSLEVGSSTH